jgi:hypothetical protein
VEERCVRPVPVVAGLLELGASDAVDHPGPPMPVGALAATEDSGEEGRGEDKVGREEG